MPTPVKAYLTVNSMYDLWELNCYILENQPPHRFLYKNLEDVKQLLNNHNLDVEDVFEPCSETTHQHYWFYTVIKHRTKVTPMSVTPEITYHSSIFEGGFTTLVKTLKEKQETLLFSKEISQQEYEDLKNVLPH